MHRALAPSIIVSVAFGLAFLYLPIAILIVYSFNDSQHGRGLGRLVAALVSRAVCNDSAILQAAWVSLRIAFLSATLATILGTLAALALVRMGRFRGRLPFSAMSYAPLVMPEVIIGLALLLLFVAADIERGFWTTMLAHTTLTMCFVTVIVQSRLLSFDWSLEDTAESRRDTIDGGQYFRGGIAGEPAAEHAHTQRFNRPIQRGPRRFARTIGLMRILVVPALQGVVRDGQVANRAREHADMIETIDKRIYASSRQAPEARLQAEHSAKRSGHANRAVRIGAERQRHEAGGNRRRRAARRSSGDSRKIMRATGCAVVCVLGREAIGELVHVERAHKNRAGGFEPRDRERRRVSRADSSARFFEPAMVTTPAISNRFLAAKGTPAQWPHVLHRSRLGHRCARRRRAPDRQERQ